MKSKEDIKSELINYQPTPEERLAIRSAMFNFITLATVGAASLGMSARLWARSRNARTGIPTILATFTGLTLGGALGMDRGMHKLRESLPPNSTLLQVIRENDELKKETLLSGPIKQQESTADLQMELIEDQLSKELTEDQSTTQ